MAKWKKSSANKQKKYSAQFAKTAENKKRNIEKEKKKALKNK